MALERDLRRLNCASARRSTTALGIWVHPVFLGGTLFVGGNLLQCGVTNWCPPIAVLRHVGMHS